MIFVFDSLLFLYVKFFLLLLSFKICYSWLAASVLKAVLKYGKKPYEIDEHKRDTYKHPSASTHGPSSWNIFGGEPKQLMVVCKKKLLVPCFCSPSESSYFLSLYFISHLLVWDILVSISS